MKRILTGVKPTGAFHLGNYVSAVKPLLALQQEKDAEIYLFEADLHALADKDAKKSTETDLFAAYVALGVDPKRVVMYRQSEFPQITELAWIFTCLSTLPYLQMGHAYKDATQKGREGKMGLLMYPVLMAADILLPDAEVIPVGEDQRQHLEVARDMARKFNQTYGDYFKEPEGMIQKDFILPGTDGEKMSKSNNNTIPMFGTDEEIRKSIMGIVTDSTPQGEPLDPNTCVICTLLKCIASDEEYAAMEKRYKEGSISYKEAKEYLYDTFMKHFAEARETYKTIKSEDILAPRRDALRTMFDKRLQEIRTLIGLT